jgi:cell division control protein 7
MSWDKFVEKVNPDILSPPHPNEHLYPYTLPAYREKILQHLQREAPANDEEEDEDERPQKYQRRAAHDEDDDEEDPTPRRLSLKRKEREDDEGCLGKDAHPNGRRRTNSYSSSPLRFPESSPAVHKPSGLASVGHPPSNLPTNRSSSGSHPHPSTSPCRQDTDTIQPVCPPLETPQSYEDAIYHAMDLVSKLLEPEAVRRITPAAALAHPFLLEEVPDPTVEGGTRMLDDDDYVPHLFGEGVCGEYHFWDEVTEQGGVVVRRRVAKEDEGEEDGRGSSVSREGAGSSSSVVTRKRVVRRKVVKEDLVDLDEEDPRTSESGRVDEYGDGDEELVPASEGEEEEDQWEWEETRLLVSAGEGIAIGREPCEFHKDYLSY